MSGFLRDVDQQRALLGCYTALSGSSVATFRDNILVSSSSWTSLNLEDETDRLSRNVSTELPLNAA
jgi:hypothetical protein